MCCQNWHLFCNQWLDFKFPWFKLCPQLRLCIFLTALIIHIMAHFCGIDIQVWIVRFLDLWTCTIRCHFSVKLFFYWYGEFHTMILKIHSFYTDSYIWIAIHLRVQYTNQVLESIVPLSWSKQFDDDKTSSVYKTRGINKVHLLQTNKHTHKWIF